MNGRIFVCRNGMIGSLRGCALLVGSMVLIWSTVMVLKPASLAAQTAVDKAGLQVLGTPEGKELAGLLKQHRVWLKSLGDPVVLDTMGRNALSAEQTTDPRRLVSQGRRWSEFIAPGLNLTAANLSESTLNEARLENTVLRHAQLHRTHMRGARLDQAVLDRAEMSEVDISGAVLNGASLKDVDLRGANLRRASLLGADLSGADLSGADLTETNLNGANLSGADLSGTNLYNADLSGANLSGASLYHADLKEARLMEVDLREAELFGADLTGVFLMESDLRGAHLRGGVFEGVNLFANRLQGTNLDGVDLSGVFFEPSPKQWSDLSRDLSMFSEAQNLGLMTYHNDAQPLKKLRSLLKRGDYRREVLDVTYAIRRGERSTLSREGTLMERVGSFFLWIFVEFPVEYGASPLRPLMLLFILIGLFGLFYLLPLCLPSKRFGAILRITPNNQFFRFSNQTHMVPLKTRSWWMFPLAFWFSTLSALNIGGRIFNLDDMFINCQTTEYYLRATGWIRTISGVQAVVSLYLILLTLLVFFEKITF